MTSGIVMLTRRSALTGTVIVLVSGLAGFLVARSSAATTPQAGAAANAYGPLPPGSGQTRLAALAQVPPGGGVVLDSADIVLTLDRAGALNAFSATCTHQGCRVNAVQDGQILCPCHGSRFDAGTGAVLAGPAPRPLPRVAVVVRDGTVYET